MTFCIGIDEAGYGPNFGPLLIAGTVWEVPSATAGDPLQPLVEFLAQPSTVAANGRPLLRIDDSKAVYRAGQSLAALEQAVLAGVANSHDGQGAGVPGTWRTAWQRLVPGAQTTLDHTPWYREFDTTVPCHASPADVAAASSRLRSGLQQTGIRLRTCRVCAVFPEVFNRDVRQWGSKAEALSRWTVQLLHALLDELPPEPVDVRCDKHGGRSRYGPLLQTEFPDTLVQVRRESRAESRYRWRSDERYVEARFTAKGDRYLPTALASMTAKLFREFAMLAFNDFWRQCVPDLKPTAGYPQDAKRFRLQIQAAQRSAGIPDAQLWRER